MVLLWLGVKPKSSDDVERLDRALAVLTTADPPLVVKTSAADGSTLLGAGSEEHLEVAADRLAREFGVRAEVTRVEIAYVEALTASARGEATYARPSGGRGQFAQVRLHVEPGMKGAGYLFESVLAGRAIPEVFVPAIDEGVRAVCARGVLAGYPIEDVRVTLYDGSFHELDSSAAAFRIAGAMAFMDAAKKAQPVLLEPIMHVFLVVPDEFVSVVNVLLSGGHRRLTVHRAGGRWATIGARLPLSETFGLVSNVRRVTAGRGICHITFSHYAPAARAGDDRDRDTPVREPNHPRTPLRGLYASVPEPPDDLFVDVVRRT